MNQGRFEPNHLAVGVENTYSLNTSKRVHLLMAACVGVQWPDTSSRQQEALAAFRGGLLNIRAATSAAASAVQQVGGRPDSRPQSCCSSQISGTLCPRRLFYAHIFSLKHPFLLHLLPLSGWIPASYN